LVWRVHLFRASGGLRYSGPSDRSAAFAGALHGSDGTHLPAPFVAVV